MKEGHICNKYCAFGRLGNELIIFHYGNGSFIYTNILEVIKPDGTITDYVDDEFGDLKPDLIRIEDGETFTVYVSGGERLWEGKEEFKRYMIQIFKARREMNKKIPKHS